MTGVVTKKVLTDLSKHCKDEAEKEKMAGFGTKALHHSEVEAKGLCLIDILNMFPSLDVSLAAFF